jgi:septum formation protein
MTSTRSSAILLASRSPRRRRLIQWLGLEVEVTHVDTPEELDTPLARDPSALAVALATEKAHAARELREGDEVLTLCFDTIVVDGDRLLGKPGGEDEAREMLRSLSGRTHEVVTGCAILSPGHEEPFTFCVTTRVRMKDLSESRIAEWMAMGTYTGCAGAYNIEAQVASVDDDECFQNVAGIPLCHLFSALTDPQLPGRPAAIRSPVHTCDAALGRRCRLGPRVIGGAQPR